MSWAAVKKLADQLRTVPLEAVLRLSGAQPDRDDRHKWHTSQGVLSVTGAKFMNWTRAQGGGGAIDLVMHLHGLPFAQALQWLSQNFSSSCLLQCQSVALRPALALPPPDANKLCRVRRYLIQERHLPSPLIEALIQSGTLYADSRANAVFLLLGKEKQPVGAELRGTTAGSWRSLAPGSRKDLGFFAIPVDSRPAVILVESAIDALSCFTLHSHYRCISTAGARPNPRWLPDLLNSADPVYCGFDADSAGEQMAQSMIALYPGVQRLQPPAHDWNDVLRARL